MFRLKTPIDDIIPQLKRFSDIAAGTGQDAATMMTEYAEAKLNPMMRGRMLQRLMREGVVSEAELRQAGINPLLMKREGGLDRLGMQPFDKIFGNLAQKNMGKAAELADNLGKNTEGFWDSLTKVRETLGEVFEKVLHLNGILKGGAKFFGWLSETIQKMPGWLKMIAVGVGALLAAIGPVILAIVAIGHALLFAKLAAIGLKLAGYQAMSGILEGAVKVSMAIAGITGQILIGVAAALALIYIIRELNVFSKGAQKQGLYEKSLTETKPGEVNLLTGKGSINKFVPHTMTAEQRRMADFANGIKSTVRAGTTIQNSMTVQVTVPPGTTPQQVAGIKAGAEAAHRPILDSISRHLVLSINKAHR